MTHNLYKYQKEDWPWVWAIRDQEQLDWRKDLKDDDKMKQVSSHDDEQPPLLPVPVLFHIWIGNQLSVLDLERLQELEITHILNVAGGTTAPSPVLDYQRLGITYMKLTADDLEGYPLLDKHLTRAMDFIALARDKNGRCVVHCEAGLNRSGLLVAAAVMLETGWNVLKTVKLLRRQRRDDYVLCNESFQEQLVALARRHDLLGPRPGTKDSIVKQAPPPETEREINVNWYEMCYCGKC